MPGRLGPLEPRPRHRPGPTCPAAGERSGQVDGLPAPADLDHPGTWPAQPIAAGPLNAPGLHLTQTLRPDQQGAIAPGGGRNPGRGQAAAKLIQDAGHMNLAVSVDPTVTLLGSWCAMVVMAVSLLDKGRWLRRPSGRTTLRRVCCDRLLSGHVRSAGARLDDDRGPGRQITAKAPGQ